MSHCSIRTLMVFVVVAAIGLMALRNANDLGFQTPQLIRSRHAPLRERFAAEQAWRAYR
jgi:hypothetical protein